MFKSNDGSKFSPKDQKKFKPVEISTGTLRVKAHEKAYCLEFLKTGDAEFQALAFHLNGKILNELLEELVDYEKFEKKPLYQTRVDIARSLILNTGGMALSSSHMFDIFNP